LRFGVKGGVAGSVAGKLGCLRSPERIAALLYTSPNASFVNGAEDAKIDE
jgi:hypothetical protein